MTRRKVKNGKKSPWGQCLTRPVPNGRRRSDFWLVPEKHKFSGTNQKPERRRPFGTSLVRHCPQGLFLPFFTFLCATFFRLFRLSLAPFICPWVSEDVFWPESWYIYLLSFPRFRTLSIEQFWLLFWSILNGVTLKTSNSSALKKRTTTTTTTLD